LPISVLVFAVIVVLYLLNSIKILRDYERGVIFRLGRSLPTPKGPGIIPVFRPINRPGVHGPRLQAAALSLCADTNRRTGAQASPSRRMIESIKSLMVAVEHASATQHAVPGNDRLLRIA